MYYEMPLNKGDNAFMYDGPTGRAADIMATITPYLIIAYQTDSNGAWQQVLADTILTYGRTLFVKVSQDCVWRYGEALKAETLGPVSITLSDYMVPARVAAGEPFVLNLQVRNSGKAGRGRVMVNDQTVSARDYEAQELYYLSVPYEMPYDDWSFHVVLQSEDVQTEERTIPVFAGFPAAVMGDVSAPGRVQPGQVVGARVSVRNTGYRGGIGVSVVDDATQERVVSDQRLDQGGELGYAYQAEMPAVRIAPFYFYAEQLDRQKRWSTAQAKSVGIQAINCLLHEANSVFITSDRETSITGFVAGEGIAIEGAQELAPAVGPVPLPYRGSAFVASLDKGKSIVVEFKSLTYIRVEFSEKLATARGGQMVSKGATCYEYSIIPTPAMAMSLTSSMFYSLTRPRPSIR